MSHITHGLNTVWPILISHIVTTGNLEYRIIDMPVVPDVHISLAVLKMVFLLANQTFLDFVNIFNPQQTRRREKKMT